MKIKICFNKQKSLIKLDKNKEWTTIIIRQKSAKLNFYVI